LFLLLNILWLLVAVVAVVILAVAAVLEVIGLHRDLRLLLVQLLL
jgi:hypothetical protein